MISYAQNREDVLLARAFEQQTSGFYIDIGANHPTYDSVTRHFYESGWSGINVEPGETYSELARERPRDTNLNLAISNRPGTIAYYEFPGTGLSTLCVAEVAARMDEGRTPVQRQVEALTLKSICESYVSREIDFISIDVEGHEREVIEGGDWQQWRPRVALIESTRPISTEPSHEPWEPLLLSAGYQFAVFDGLNRFYVRDEDAGLLPALRAPLTVLDGVVPFAHAREVRCLQERIAELETALHDVKRANPLGYVFGRALTRLRRLVAGRAAEARPCPSNS